MAFLPPSASHPALASPKPSLGAWLRLKRPRAGSLGQRAAGAVGWNLFQLIGANLLRLGSNLIMTRLLVPDAFALVSLVFILISAITLMTDIGIRQSIVREEDGETTSFLRTAWVLKVLRGFGLGALLLLLAFGVAQTAAHWAPLGTVYADPRLSGLIALGALVPVLIGLHSANRELAERRLAYKPLALLEISGQIVSILAMLAFAALSATVWALMAGALMAYVVTTLGSHLMLPGPRMRFAVDRAIAWRIWTFGKWLIGASLFTFIARNADKFIFGALLSITTMGLLTIAYTWIMAGQTLVQQLLSKVAYPVLSEIKRDRAQDLEAALARTQRFVDVLCVSACAAAVLLGPWLVEVLYTAPYHAAGPFIAVLGLGFLCLRFELLYALMLTLGDSRGMMWLWVQRAGVLVLGVPLVYTQAGLTAALALTALHPLISVPFALLRLRGYLSRRATVEAMIWAVVSLAVAALVIRTQTIL